jgi:hypothetical protein
MTNEERVAALMDLCAVDKNKIKTAMSDLDKNTIDFLV